MSRPRFLADHDLNDAIITGLLRREPTIEWTRLREVNASQLPDPQVLELATNLGLIVVSHDTNTMVGHAHARIAENLPVFRIDRGPSTRSSRTNDRCAAANRPGLRG